MKSTPSVDGIKLCLLTWLVNKVSKLLVVCQLSCDVIGYEDSSLARFDPSILTVKHSFIVSQIVRCPDTLSYYS